MANAYAERRVRTRRHELFGQTVERRTPCAGLINEYRPAA